jgi:predicted DNA binding CopG/RHH family protein
MPRTKKQKKLKPLPRFKSEDEERDFWSVHDSVDYIDWSQGQRLSLPNLKPTARTISVRLPVTMITNLKMLAHKRDVPYQSLLKTFLADRLRKEMRADR